MNIPDKAVEAAAKAGYERLEDCDWSELPYEERKAWIEDYGHALKAAAPLIVAQALREHAANLNDAGDSGCQDEYIGLYEAANMTKARADELDPQ